VTTSIPTLVVPDDVYQEGLDFCNARLREQGKPEIAELPAGIPLDPYQCPCGKACGVRVIVTTWNDSGGRVHGGAPEKFVRFFDLNSMGETLPIRASAALTRDAGGEQ
jgi:hypothetical protein